MDSEYFILLMVFIFVIIIIIIIIVIIAYNTSCTCKSGDASPRIQLRFYFGFISKVGLI
jgi:heme/copper-type cytochrome/quinol oxidase subunit 2